MLAGFGQQPASSGFDLDGDGIDDDLEFAFEDDPFYYRCVAQLGRAVAPLDRLCRAWS